MRCFPSQKGPLYGASRESRVGIATITAPATQNRRQRNLLLRAQRVKNIKYLQIVLEELIFEKTEFLPPKKKIELKTNANVKLKK